MPAGVPNDAADRFAALRPRMFSIAYRMLGVRSDAEDVVQDAWLRWSATQRDQVLSDEAWLVTVVTRLSIDRLRTARIQRETYVGHWLPEPLVEVDEHSPEAAAELASDLSVALMWVLERLAPEERAAFLLRQSFDWEYAEIAALLGKSEPACRQMVHRAAERVRQAHPRFPVSRDAHRSLLQRFVTAARSGDQDAMRALLASDVAIIGDGGGKASASVKIVRGAQRLVALYRAAYRRFGARAGYRSALVNGEPGVLRYIDGKIESALAFSSDGERITAVYAIRNPDKLAAIPVQSAWPATPP